MKNIIHSAHLIAKNFTNIFFPAQCIACASYLEDPHIFCNQCILTIPTESSLYCTVCEKRLSSFTVCHSSPLDAIGYATSYHISLIRDLIHLYKYEQVTSLCHDLGTILISYLNTSGLLPFLASKKNDVVVAPIPLHPLRERTRGFNQAKLIANLIAKHYHLPLHDILVRTQNNPPQAQMKSREKRIKNAEHLFSLKQKTTHLIKNKTILLVDDVATSCSTLLSAAEILKRNGAKKVIGIVLAKG
ncbi:MAG: ComF family protein [Parcubacteria group bacterium]|nr:ComF family protein [Parcubacteria group bacterium]